MSKGIQVTVNTSKLAKLIANLGKHDVVRILHDGTAYGLYQEFGTARGVPPHPFIRPAIEAVRPSMFEGWKQVLEQGTINPEDFIDKIARDAEGIAKREAPVDTGNLRASIMVSTEEEFNARG